MADMENQMEKKMQHDVEPGFAYAFGLWFPRGRIMRFEGTHVDMVHVHREHVLTLNLTLETCALGKGLQPIRWWMKVLTSFCMEVLD